MNCVSYWFRRYKKIYVYVSFHVYIYMCIRRPPNGPTPPAFYLRGLVCALALQLGPGRGLWVRHPSWVCPSVACAGVLVGRRSVPPHLYIYIYTVKRHRVTEFGERLLPHRFRYHWCRVFLGFPKGVPDHWYIGFFFSWAWMPRSRASLYVKGFSSNIELKLITWSTLVD